jgi:lipoyl(octanoyl) transferase
MDEVWVVQLGLLPYADARELQRELEARRQQDEVPDVLLLLEHPPIYTKGRRTQKGELPMGEPWYRMQGIEVTETDRGGRATYHGPGQLVGYPIVSLKPYRDDVHGYLRRMERLMTESLGAYGVGAAVVEDLTGVWTGAALPPEGANAADVASDVTAGALRKIGSIGVHVNKGVTTHGFAINVNNDLQPFEWIVPCGIDGCRMTSLCRELGAEQDMDAFVDAVAERFGDIYGRERVDISPSELAERAGLAEIGAVPTVSTG